MAKGDYLYERSLTLRCAEVPGCFEDFAGRCGCVCGGRGDSFRAFGGSAQDGHIVEIKQKWRWPLIAPCSASLKSSRLRFFFFFFESSEVLNIWISGGVLCCDSRHTVCESRSSVWKRKTQQVQRACEVCEESVAGQSVSSPRH